MMRSNTERQAVGTLVGLSLLGLAECGLRQIPTETSLCVAEFREVILVTQDTEYNEVTGKDELTGETTTWRFEYVKDTHGDSYLTNREHKHRSARSEGWTELEFGDCYNAQTTLTLFPPSERIHRLDAYVGGGLTQ